MATTKMIDQIEEVFDDEGDMRSVDEIAWKKLKEARLKDGFADGKYLGEESTLQNGFDHGYHEGFELSHSISTIQGLLAVVHMQIAKSDSALLQRSREIKLMLDKFKESVSNVKLNYLLGDQPVDNDDDLLECADENCNTSNVKNTAGSLNCCYFSSLNAKTPFIKDDGKVESIMIEFEKLKSGITLFISDCNQPNIMDQVSLILERWKIQHVTRYSPCETQCACVNESTRASGLLTKT